MSDNDTGGPGMKTPDAERELMRLSVAIESLLVERNPRHMQRARAALAPGYLLRAASALHDCCTGATGRAILIGTGFPVTGTFETDGPAGAIALYDALARAGAEPVIACGPPLSEALADDYRVLALVARDLRSAEVEAKAQLARLQPGAVLAIERPGLAADGRYYNMRGQDISDRCYFFDPYLTCASCPTIGIGDGGNEVGMGNLADTLADMDISASVTRCSELVVADVSNWAAYGLLGILGCLAGRDFLAELTPLETLNYLSRLGSVDGVTGTNTLTEDGMPVSEGLAVIAHIRDLASGDSY